MAQVEVPREKWQSFCDLFTRQHQSWIVNVSVSDTNVSGDPGLGKVEERMHPLTRSTVFRGVTAEPHGRDYAISIIAGVPPGEVTHFVYSPAHVYFYETAEGLHEGLLIENQSGEMTLLRFRAAALPEMLDGIQGSEVLRAK